MIIEAKNRDVARTLLAHSYDYLLVEILVWMGKKQPWFRQIYTSGFRVHDNGVHGVLPCRAVDLRCHDQTIGYYMEKAVNNVWEYDYRRPHKGCALYHTSTGKEKDLHLHLQVHPNTKAR